jgi:beta-glucosidase
MNTFLSFPKNFLWGTATASYQIEGGCNEDGKGESIWDRFSHTPGKIKNGDTGDIACDHYQRWAEDIRLMQEIGLKAYRFSIAWTRVLPAGRGKVNQPGLDFYSHLVDDLLKAGIIPFVTLYHWDLPQALQEEGGWAARSTAEAFIEYTDVVTRCLGDRVKHWITHNEPSVVTMDGYLNGEHAPGIQDFPAALKTSHHLLLSHGWSIPIIRQNSPDAEVGITLNVNWTVPASNSAYDRDLQRREQGIWCRWFLDPLYGRGYPADIVADATAEGYLPHNCLNYVQDGDMQAIAMPTDFLGVNYYTRFITREHNKPDNLPEETTASPEGKEHWTDMGWEVYPDGLFNVLAWLYFDYQPAKIFITENGASYSDGPDAEGRVHDHQRIDYLHSHFTAAHRAVQAGIPLEGYFVWSLLDNFEWAEGYSQRFGLVWVDYSSLERKLKDSARWYKKVIAENRLELLTDIQSTNQVTG